MLQEMAELNSAFECANDAVREAEWTERARKIRIQSSSSAGYDGES